MYFPSRRQLCRAALVLSLLAVVMWIEVSLVQLSTSRRPTSPDALGAGSDPLQYVIAGRNIFFIEPTCIFEEQPWFGLDPMEACAVESAVRHNELHDVYVLHTCKRPADVDMNVPKGAKPVHVTLDFFFKNTASSTNVHRFSSLYAKEILGVVTLWKYGGVYLSLDFIIQRPLRNLGENWVLAVEPQQTLVRAMALAPRHPVAAQLIMESLRVRGGDQPPSGAAQLITSVLKDHCGFRQVNITTETDCHGFKILPRTMLLPVPKDDWQDLYVEELAKDTLGLVQHAYGVCFYHEMRGGQLPHVKAPYGRLALEHCPTVFAASRFSYLSHDTWDQDWDHNPQHK